MNIQNPKALRKDAAFSDAVMQAAQLHLNGWLDEAVKIYEAVLKARPNHFDARQLLGDVRFRQGRFVEAEHLLRKAISINGTVAQVHLMLGKTLAALTRHCDALKCVDKAISMQPGLWDAHYTRGFSLHRLGRLDEALSSFSRAIEINARSFEALNGYGAVLRDLGQCEETLDYFDAALAVNPDYVEALVNRGNVLKELSRFAEAEACLRKAMTLEPANAHACHSRSILALLMGDLPSGWTGYERRFDVDVAPAWQPGGTVPVWQGEDVTGKSVLVLDEQGVGDVLQFFRYVILLASRGASVTFLVRAHLHRILSAQSPNIRLIADHDGETYDYQIPLMSLPGVFKTSPETIPPVIPYLRPDPERVSRWGEVLGGQGLKVGIAWQGNPVGRVDIGRSVPLKFFAPLAAIPDVRLISLQKGHGTDQLGNLPSGMQVETLGADFDSGPDAFIDTAAVMANLDLVITSDTSIAHLAGTLQRPIWLALKHVPDWRWMLERTDSPWYAAMRLYRQTSRGDWHGVFERIAADLSRMRS